MTPLNRSLLKVEEALDVVLLGKREQVRLALACLLANGHLLIEESPGWAKPLWHSD